MQEEEFVRNRGGYVEYTEGLRTPKTWKLFERAHELMPGGASSHGQCYAIFDPYPLAFERGQDARVWDIDGNEFVDFIGGRRRIRYQGSRRHTKIYCLTALNGTIARPFAFLTS